MSKSINRVILVGRLGRDPELRSTPTGKAVCEFSMATDRPRATTTPVGDAAAETTDWHRIVAWEKLAETCHRYLTKGQQVCVEGRIRNRKWTTTEGQKRTSSEVVATDVMFLSPKRDGPTEAPVATPFDPTEAW